MPPVLNREIIDEVIAVDDEDADSDRAPDVARREGVLVGISCGAALAAAIALGRPPRVEGQADRGRCCPTRASATCRRRSSPRSRLIARKLAGNWREIEQEFALGMLGLGTMARVLGEIRRDVAAAHERDPAARGVSGRRSC